jgi:uncharacterized membrane-anchored protein
LVLEGVVAARATPYFDGVSDIHGANTRDIAATRVLTKVPEITLIFWVLKLLTTGMGESMSDFLGQKSVPLAGASGASSRSSSCVTVCKLWFSLTRQG